MEVALKSDIERRAEAANRLSAFTGVNLLHIRQQVEQMLSLIGRNGIFDQYTRHDISHIDQMLSIAEWIIPDDTKNAMTPVADAGVVHLLSRYGNAGHQGGI